MSSVVGSARLKANDFVQAYQNPFGKELSTIYDPIQKAQAAGTLTADQANQALQQFNEQYTAFQKAAQQWQDQGGDYARVVKQAMDPGGDFMKTINMVQTNLTNWTSSLKSTDGSSSSANTPTTPPALQTILSQLGLTPDEAARSAAVQTTKRSMAAPGFAGTILTGQGAPASTKKTTLLGYA